jgi:hypothetical protein
MSKTIFLLLSILLLCLGCAGPALTSRVVQEESSWSVRLDSYQNAGSSPVRYEHPATWTVEELSAILSRLLLEDRVGLMDSARPPRPVFSVEEIGLLAPAIRHSFQQAKSSEWISFYLFHPNASGLAVTSGGIFVADSRLHVVVANHHALIAGGSEELASIRTNPFHSVRGSGGMLTFESSRFVMGRQANWSGSHRASASELILDHRGFLSFLKLPGAVTAPALPVRPVFPVPSSEPRNSRAATEEADPKTVILRLQEEVERLKRKVDEQEAEIARLKEKR